MVLETMVIHLRNILTSVLGHTTKEGMMIVEVPVVVCSWYLKYSVHMLDMTDVIVDVLELYLNCK